MKSQKSRNEFHEIDPEVSFKDAIAWVENQYPWKGPQAQLARILGVTRAQVHLWSRREDGLMPPPWNWRVREMMTNDATTSDV